MKTFLLLNKNVEIVFANNRSLIGQKGKVISQSSNKKAITLLTQKKELKMVQNCVFLVQNKKYLWTASRKFRLKSLKKEVITTYRIANAEVPQK